MLTPLINRFPLTRQNKRSVQYVSCQHAQQVRVPLHHLPLDVLRLQQALQQPGGLLQQPSAALQHRLVTAALLASCRHPLALLTHRS
jgi:hypothetical protein